MKYYKDKDCNVFGFEEDGSQDDYISSGLVFITEKEANKLIKKEQESNRAEKKHFVPDVLSRFEMLSILKILKLNSGESMYKVLDNFIKELTDDSSDNIIIKTAWDTSTEFRRNSLLVAVAQKSLNLSDNETDELFKKGAQLST